jgi:hypothetical protein
MSDALVDFALTGKQSFGAMLRSMLTDLVKFENRKVFADLFSDKGIGSFTSLTKKLISKGKDLFGFGTSAKDAEAKAAKTAAEASVATAAELADPANMGMYKKATQPGEIALDASLGTSAINPLYVTIVGSQPVAGLAGAELAGAGSSVNDANSILGSVKVEDNLPSAATAAADAMPSDWFKQEEDFQKGITSSADKGISEVFNTKSQTMLGISDSFTKTFGGIANGFSNVINSVLSSIGGGGGGGFLGGLLNAAVDIGMSYFGAPGGQATAGAMQDTGFISNGNIQPGDYTGPKYANAMGGVYDQSRMAYAKGDMFTNTIVSKPTTFGYAKGTGLMGEAGPEAIMPLKRGANGSLGVQSVNGGNNVDVVVNNYGSEKATTKQSTDSRGNRRIEVIVGEMTAGEMTRTNSPVQNTMRGTFGISPQLTRR